MNRKGWLSRDDFEALDRLIGKLGYGGYYDFLECLKEIGSKIGAFTVQGGEIDRMDVKTVPDMEAILQAWGSRVSNWRLKNPEWDNAVLEAK